MAEQCTTCESTFRGYAPLVLTTTRNAAGDVLVYAQNAGRSIVYIQRMLVCLRYGSGSTSTLYVRSFSVGGNVVEQGSTQLKYSVNAPTAVSVEVEAEYYEVGGRAQSCVNTF